MKTITKYLLIGLLSVSFALPQALAQNIDANRMNRDIRIMENILAELFRTTVTSRSSETVIFNEALGASSRGIRGTYLKNYGIIFNIPGFDPMRPQMHVTGSGSYAFYYGSDDDDTDKSSADREVTEEEVVSRITDFLKNYASTIGQLSDEESVMVIYGAFNQSRSYNVVLYNSQGNTDRQEVKALPVISVSAKVKDLADYRSGKIDDAKMKDRIHVEIAEDKKYPDLQIMANIFESALEGSEDNGFRMMRDASYMMLENFGAIFNFDTRYSGNRNGFLGLRTTGGNRVGVRVQGQGYTLPGRRVDVSEEEAKAIAEEEQKSKEDMLEAYASMKTHIAEYLVDYGRTLNSVNSDQFILTSVNVGRTGLEEIPERVDFQLKKSVLENLDRGRISREDAIKQVVVSEY